MFEPSITISFETCIPFQTKIPHHHHLGSQRGLSLLQTTLVHFPRNQNWQRSWKLYIAKSFFKRSTIWYCQIKPHFPISNSAYNSFLSKISCVIYGNGFVVWILCLPPKKDCRHVLITHTRVDNAHVPYYREKSNHLACSFHHQTLPFWVSCTQVLRLFLDSAHFLLDNRLALTKIIGSGWYWATKKLEVSAPRILTKMKTFSIPLSVVIPRRNLLLVGSPRNFAL